MNFTLVILFDHSIGLFFMLASLQWKIFFLGGGRGGGWGGVTVRDVWSRVVEVGIIKESQLKLHKGREGG